MPKGEARTEILQIRLTRSERINIEALAKDDGKLTSEWVRDRLTRLTGLQGGEAGRRWH